MAPSIVKPASPSLPTSDKPTSTPPPVPTAPPKQYESALRKKSEFHRVVSGLQLDVSQSLSRVAQLEWRLSTLKTSPSVDCISHFQARVLEFMTQADSVTRDLAALVAAASQPVDSATALAFQGLSVDVARVDVQVAALQLHATKLTLAFAKIDPTGGDLPIYCRWL